jgi:hypothetical protein
MPERNVLILGFGLIGGLSDFQIKGRHIGLPLRYFSQASGMTLKPFDSLGTGLFRAELQMAGVNSALHLSRFGRWWFGVCLFCCGFAYKHFDPGAGTKKVDGYGNIDREHKDTAEIRKEVGCLNGSAHLFTVAVGYRNTFYEP